ncbi:MAG: polysaccharide biosynthesis/export family protein [Bacteroidota bacterium]
MNRLFLLMMAAVLTISSCVSHQELLNFTEGEDFSSLPLDINNIPTLKIQSDDLLSIKVTALDIEAALPFNLDPPTGSQNLNTGNNIRPLLGYLVNSDGVIDFPIIGKISAAGLTLDELKLLLQKELESYLKEPVIVVRFLNFRVTVLGEVQNPSTFFMANERVTILDALGQAGDLTPYANRKNVLVIREQNGQRSFGRVSLQDRQIFESDFFYLRQNDVIYIEPLDEKTSTVRDQTQRILPWLSVITSLTTLVITLTRL